MSMGGVGAAATGLIGTSQIRDDAVTYSKIAPNSVGKVRLADGGVINSKLAHNSVSYQDIQPGAVGSVRSNTNQMQERVKGTCAPGTAIGSINKQGGASCNAAAPQEYGTSPTASSVTVGTSATSTGSVALPVGASYLGFANTTLVATSGASAVTATVKCTFTVGTTTTSQTRVLRTDGTTGDTTQSNISMQLAGAAGTSTVACAVSVPSGSTVPSVSGVSAINAIATAANNS